MSPIKIISVGAGSWGKNVVRTLSQIGVLTCVVEAADGLVAQLHVDYPDLTVCGSYTDLLAKGDFDAVAIATPACTHYKISKDFLLAGKDVFVEKPMAMSAVECEELIALAESQGRILMVGHLLLYKPAIEFIQNFLAKEELGKVFTLHQERAKLGKARSVENALWSLGVHDVAALLYIVGESPVKVSAVGHAGLQSGIEDDIYLHMTFANGCQAHLHNSWLWPTDRRGLTIVGEKGMLIYDERFEKVTLVKKSIDANLCNVDGGEEVVFQASQECQPLRIELQHFIDCIGSRHRPRSCGRNGLEVIRVLEAAALGA
jgi:predicted dehydrogenase